MSGSFTREYVVWVCAHWEERDAARFVIEAQSGQELEFRMSEDEPGFTHHFARFTSGNLEGIDLYLLAPTADSGLALSNVLSACLQRLIAEACYGRAPFAVFSTGVCAGYPEGGSTAEILEDNCVAERAVSLLAGSRAISPTDFQYKADVAKARGLDL